MRLSFRAPVLVLALFALLLAVPAVANDEASAHAPAVATGCSGASPALVPLLAPGSTPAWWAGSRPSRELTTQEPIAQQGPPIRQGYCRCGCGIRCETDADCGVGGSCVGFISCC